MLARDGKDEVGVCGSRRRELSRGEIGCIGCPVNAWLPALDAVER